MRQYDKVLVIYNKLKEDLGELDLKINSNTGISNRIILAIAEAMSEGIEIGETSGRNKALGDLKSFIFEMKEKY